MIEEKNFSIEVVEGAKCALTRHLKFGGGATKIDIATTVTHPHGQNTSLQDLEVASLKIAIHYLQEELKRVEDSEC